MTNRDERIQSISGFCQALETMLVAFLVPEPASGGSASTHCVDSGYAESEPAPTAQSVPPYALGDRLVRVEDGVEKWRGEITSIVFGDPYPFGITPDDHREAGFFSMKHLEQHFCRDPHEARAALPVVPDLEVPKSVPAEDEEEPLPEPLSPEVRATLRVGMTWQETNDLPLSPCGTDNPDCTDEKQCAACVDYDALHCACGHMFVFHHNGTLCEECESEGEVCSGFSLASWQGGPPAPEKHSDGTGDEAACPSGETAASASKAPAQEATPASVNRVASAPLPRRFCDPRGPTPPLRSGQPPATPFKDTPTGRNAEERHELVDPPASGSRAPAGDAVSA